MTGSELGIALSIMLIVVALCVLLLVGTVSKDHAGRCLYIKFPLEEHRRALKIDCSDAPSNYKTILVEGVWS